MLPYLKRIFEEVIYSDEIAFITLKMRGKKITVYSRKSVINAIKDEEEADVILKWLQSVVNETWEKRLDIKKGKQKTPKPYEAFSPE